MSAAAPAKIGLEVHVYVATRAKMFCACSADFLAAKEANANVCPTCTGQPGAKPMAPNARAIEAGVALARALGMTLQERATFLRKHYWYPDLPSNYQRTSEPFATGGSLLGVRLTEVHWEEDPGQYELREGSVDYNRSGAPLLELVTEPDFRDAAHARAFLDELRLALAYMGVARAEAGIKADCNVSVAGGERVEVKNVNSVRNVEAAIAFELARQREAVARGERLPRETRHFDEAAMRTVRLRTKESASDYRFLADPDLAPVDVAAVAALASAAEPPFARRARIARSAGVPEAEASPLVEERALADAFDAILERGVPARAAFDFLVRDVRGELEYRGRAFADAGVAAVDLAELLAAVLAKRVTPQVGTRVLRHALDGGSLRAELAKETEATVEARGLDLDALARDALAANPKAVADYHAGKTAVVNFLVGQVMKATKGRATSEAAREAVERALRAGESANAQSA